jgi:hypothetical protein
LIKAKSVKAKKGICIEKSTYKKPANSEKQLSLGRACPYKFLAIKSPDTVTLAIKLQRELATNKKDGISTPNQRSYDVSQ